MSNRPMEVVLTVVWGGEKREGGWNYPLFKFRFNYARKLKFDT